MSLVLSDVANLVGGTLTGDGNLEIVGASIIRDASPGDITLADQSHLADALADCGASAVLVPSGFHPEGIPYVCVEDVHAAFARVVSHFRPVLAKRVMGIHPDAHVSDTAIVGENVTIHAGATVGENVEIGDGSTVHSGVHIMAGTKIGDDVTLFPRVVLYEHTIVGNRVTIHSGAVIGAYGFGYETIGGRHVRSAQLGYVEIEDDVEIGANSTIDRGTYGPTRIGEGTKIDNLVMVAHNCRLGKHNLLCSQVGVAGSCVTGDYVVMAGQVGLRDHVNIGSRAVLGAKAGIMGDVPENTIYLGIPATPEREQGMKLVALSRLPDMRRQFKSLQKQVAQLAEQLAASTPKPAPKPASEPTPEPGQAEGSGAGDDREAA